MKSPFDEKRIDKGDAVSEKLPSSLKTGNGINEVAILPQD